MLRTIFILLGIYVLYKVIFDFIIPITQTTNQVRKQFREAQQRMQEEMNNPPQQNAEAPKAARVGDYIEFEEIKK